MPESFGSKRMRWAFRLYPAYRGTGGRVTYVADDYREVRVEVPRSWRTRNYVGTIYGGSMYGAVDPIYMLMLIKLLGRDYVVWDKAATIRFKKPGKTTLYAEFNVPAAETDEIRQALETEPSIDRVYEIELKDKNGVVHAFIEKTIYISKRKENPK